MPPNGSACERATYSWVGWAPAIGNRPWLQVDLGVAAQVSFIELSMRVRLDDPPLRREVEVWGANEPGFSSYTLLASQSVSAPRYEGCFQAQVRDPGRYRYIRAVRLGDGGFFITELRVLGER